MNGLEKVVKHLILGGCFWQERLFREVYDEIRQQDDTDFKMDMMKHRDKPKRSWVSAIFSAMLVVFYLAETLFTLLVFAIS